MMSNRSLSSFEKPLYSGYAFSELPNTILSLLGGDKGGLPKDCIQPGTYERVIFILIDGFGWRFLQQYQEKYPFLSRFFKKGVVSKISSQFPSTTTAHITSLACNQPVGEHGLYEWFMYEPRVDRVVAPLLYAFAGDKKPATLQLDPKEFLPEPLFFNDLKKMGVKARIFQHESIAESIYSQWMFDGAEKISYRHWNHALSQLKAHLKSPGLFYLYFGDFDSKAHRHGLDSRQVKEALDQCFTALEQDLMTLPELSLPSTALLVTADHGMTEIHPSTTCYLNEAFPTLETYLKRGVDGHVLAPAGSCRDFFLHVQEDRLQELHEKLIPLLQDKADIYPTGQLISDGFFGPTVSERCRGRMGNLVILPRGNNSIWWHEKHRFEQKFYAMHGGITPDELETIFLFYKGGS